MASNESNKLSRMANKLSFWHTSQELKFRISAMTSQKDHLRVKCRKNFKMNFLSAAINMCEL